MSEKDIEYTPIKFDSEKTRLELLPSDAIVAVGQVLTHGAQKYCDHNWEHGMNWGRYVGALLRHVMLFMAGENIDPDSGLPIMAHAACDALFLLTYQLRAIGNDERWKLPKEYLEQLRKCVDEFDTKWS